LALVFFVFVVFGVLFGFLGLLPPAFFWIGIGLFPFFDIQNLIGIALKIALKNYVKFLYITEGTTFKIDLNWVGTKKGT
jgi:hypothetical protein